MLRLAFYTESLMHESLTERWNRISLRSKITGVTVLMLTLGLLVAGIGTMTMLRVYVLAQMDARLARRRRRRPTLEQLVGVSCDSTLNTTDERAASEYFVAIFDDSGSLL